MSPFARILMMSCLLEVGVLGRSSTLTCPQGYFVEGMVSYDRSEARPRSERFMVCMQCQLDSSAFDAMEYCIDRDFLTDLDFQDSEKVTGFQKIYDPIRGERHAATCEDITQSNAESDFFKQFREMCIRKICSVVFHMTECENLEELEEGNKVDLIGCPYYLDARTMTSELSNNQLVCPFGFTLNKTILHQSGKHSDYQNRLCIQCIKQRREPITVCRNITMTNLKTFYLRSDYNESGLCGVEFKQMTGINSENITKFLNHIEPMTCETAKRLLLPDKMTPNSLNTTPNSIETPLKNTSKSTNIHKQQSINIFDGFNLNLSPDEVDVAHVGLAGAVIIFIVFSIICCLCYCCKKNSDRISHRRTDSIKMINFPKHNRNRNSNAPTVATTELRRNEFAESHPGEEVATADINPSAPAEYFLTENDYYYGGDLDSASNAK